MYKEFNDPMYDASFDEELVPDANAIELLGYAKNNVVEILTSESELSGAQAQKLHQAYALLDEVQEYLYNN
ncbi:MAG: hypothetical protein SOX74_04965 [Candidatus Faecousia sp.]|uniref:hypothetical protein n=1 Tax=Faecousia sp. TaxID=2952921 RepID=UPI002A89FB71|nr:hypothetical protein [Candidatus Faecousia sp.]